jgi:hypothetical protein
MQKLRVSLQLFENFKPRQSHRVDKLPLGHLVSEIDDAGRNQDFGRHGPLRFDDAGLLTLYRQQARPGLYSRIDPNPPCGERGSSPLLPLSDEVMMPRKHGVHAGVTTILPIETRTVVLVARIIHLFVLLRAPTFPKSRGLSQGVLGPK